MTTGSTLLHRYDTLNHSNGADTQHYEGAQDTKYRQDPEQSRWVVSIRFFQWLYMCWKSWNKLLLFIYNNKLCVNKNLSIDKYLWMISHFCFW